MAVNKCDRDDRINTGNTIATTYRTDRLENAVGQAGKRTLV